MRGLGVREELKLQEGGSYLAQETRTLLGISKTAVLKRYQKGQLVGWREAGQGAVHFPIWQFKDHNVLPGLPEVLKIFAKEDWVDDWTRILFFLGARHSLDGRGLWISCGRGRSQKCARWRKGSSNSFRCMSVNRPVRLPGIGFAGADLPTVSIMWSHCLRIHSDKWNAAQFRLSDRHRFSHPDAPGGLLYWGENF